MASWLLMKPSSRQRQMSFLVPLVRGAVAELMVEAKEKRRVTSDSLGADSIVEGSKLIVSIMRVKINCEDIK